MDEEQATYVRVVQAPIIRGLSAKWRLASSGGTCRFVRAGFASPVFGFGQTVMRRMVACGAVVLGVRP
jgi:hypothetical protein